jgi:hypothetical protein
MRARLVLTVLAITAAGCASSPPPPMQSREAFEAYCRAHGKVARYTSTGDATYVRECVARNAPEKPGSITVP